MVKSFMWTGAIVLAIGLGAMVWFVIPHIDQTVTSGLNGQPIGALSPLAVLVAGAGLAIGSILIGIGVGRWQHPRSGRGSQSHGAEI